MGKKVWKKRLNSLLREADQLLPRGAADAVTDAEKALARFKRQVKAAKRNAEEDAGIPYEFGGSALNTGAQPEIYRQWCVALERKIIAVKEERDGPREDKENS